MSQWLGGKFVTHKVPFSSEQPTPGMANVFLGPTQLKRIKGDKQYKKESKANENKERGRYKRGLGVETIIFELKF